MDHYLKSGSQTIHIQKILVCIGLQCVCLSQKITCAQSGIYWCSPLLTDRMHFQSERCQSQAALVFPVQEMYLDSPLHLDCKDFKHNSLLAFYCLVSWYMCNFGSWVHSLIMSLGIMPHWLDTKASCFDIYMYCDLCLC